MRVSIIGATGYTGVELVKMLSRHKVFKLSSLTSESYSGKKISEVFPILSGVCDITLSVNDIENEANKADAFFLCLPHKTSMEVASKLYEKGKIVIDLSADFRLSDAALYERVYDTPHMAEDLLSKAVYGHAEIYRDKIKSAKLIAVPGCYPTSIITPLFPLLQSGLIEAGSIIADSKSGVTGAGRKPTLTNSFCEVDEDFKPYGIFTHRHSPEINHILSRASSDVNVLFTPHLLPINRGILSTIYTKSDHSIDELKSCLAKFYEGQKIVRLRFDGSIPTIKDVAFTPFVDIALYKDGKHLIIVSVLDNLMKGASSQALQCMNIIAGLSDTEGLI